LGIELMPRIRGWKRLKLYRPGGTEQLDSIEHLFTATINWRRIEEHYPAFMRLALAIYSGKLAPSAVLARINSHSSRDPFSMALQELGHAVRTAFMLRWIRDDHLRREVHKGTTKVERSHQLTKFLNFGAEGGLKTNSPADQEKAIVYNERVRGRQRLKLRHFRIYSFTNLALMKSRCHGIFHLCSRKYSLTNRAIVCSAVTQVSIALDIS
jgi:TnpA family transposase